MLVVDRIKCSGLVARASLLGGEPLAHAAGAAVLALERCTNQGLGADEHSSGLR
ncbi:MAG: hypothetical protein U0736_07390 [Gemmataceae bacterium]